MLPTAMATGYSLALLASNRIPVTSCVTQARLVTQPIHASALVMSNTCGGHLGGMLTFPFFPNFFNIKKVGVLVVSLRGVNFRFLVSLGVLRKNH